MSGFDQSAAAHEGLLTEAEAASSVIDAGDMPLARDRTVSTPSSWRHRSMNAWEEPVLIDDRGGGKNLIGYDNILIDLQ